MKSTCPHFLSCGGCSHWNLSYEEEVQKKENAFKDLFLKIIGSPLSVSLGFYKSKQETAYRSRAQLKWEGGKLGYYEEKSHQLVPLDSCPILLESLEKVLPELMEFSKQNHLDKADYYLASNEKGEVLIKFISPQNLINKDPLSLLPSSVKGLGIYHQKGHKHQRVDLFGQKSFIQNFAGFKLSAGMDSFFQINPFQYQNMVNLVTKSIEGKNYKLGFDLYAGLGSLSLPLSKHSSKLIALEFNSEAVNFAIKNIKRNLTSGVSFKCSDVKNELKEMKQLRPDFICVDPPRSGLHSDVVVDISSFLSLKKLIYVSCNPNTILRDFLGFFQRGFELESINLLDMFPRTKHLEVIAVLKR